MPSKQKPRLPTVFAGVSQKTFMGRYWPASPLWRHGSPKRFEALAELGSMGAIMTLAGRSRVELKAVFQGVQHQSNEVPTDASHVFSLYDAGATIAVIGLHRWHTEVGEWTRRLANELHVPPHTAGCNLYMSPRGKGLPMHFDDHEVIVVQLAGRKRWRIARNASVVNPLENSGAELTESIQRYANAPSPQRMPRGHSIELVPGSALFLPRGYWHSTDAQLASISMTFGFRQPTWVDLVRDYLTTRLTEDEDWREPVWDAWEPGPHRVAVPERWAVLRERLALLVADTEAAHLLHPPAEPILHPRSPASTSKQVRTRRKM